MQDTAPYKPLRPGRSTTHPIRGLQLHALQWGDPATARADRPLLVMAHGWADVGASFQFVVDALARQEGEQRPIVAADWRGFGRSSNGGSDAY
jgi:pimeloyl-ACP methyl ester carboxylesterase